MAVLFALLAAFGYGTSDFAGGLASRRYAAEPASGAVLAVEVVCVAVGVILFPGRGPHPGALEWGALGGLGGGVGALALFRGLSVGAMAIVGTVSAVLAAVIPVLVGLALGNHLGTGAAIGIAIAIPAIVLVSWQPGPVRGSGPRSERGGAYYGVIAGLGFALLFIALDRAGTRSGAWPLLPGQSVAFVVVLPAALGGVKRVGPPARREAGLMLVSGVLAGTAALSFLHSTGQGELSIVAVVTALYPAFTVVLARVLLAERWSRSQALGLIVAAVSVALVSVG